MFKHPHSLLTSAGLALALGGLALSGIAADLPAVQHAGSASYLTGGIGLEESTAIKAAMKDWPVALQFAAKDGQKADYVADVQVVVRDRAGHTTLQAVSEGPFLLADLAPGTYQVAATLADKTLHQTLEVKKGKPARATFVWPAQTAAGYAVQATSPRDQDMTR